MIKSAIAVLIGLIAIGILLGGYFLFVKGEGNLSTDGELSFDQIEDTANSDTAEPENQNANMNLSDNSEQGLKAALYGSLDCDGWQLYVEFNSGVAIGVPSYLTISDAYDDTLVSTDESKSIERLKVVMGLDDQFMQAQGSAEAYVDGFTIEFPGTFEETHAAVALSYGGIYGIGKSYQYHASLDDTGRYSKRVELFLMENEENSTYVLVQLFGKNTTDFDQVAARIFEAIQFES